MQNPVSRTREKRRSGRVFVLACLLPSVLLLTGSLQAQQTKKVRQIGFMCPAKCGQSEHDGFRDAMREFGYMEGRDIVTIYRAAESNADRLPGLAAELVG